MSNHRTHVRHWTSDVGKSFLISFIIATSVNQFIIFTESIDQRIITVTRSLISLSFFISFCFALLCFIVFGSLPIFGYCLSVIEFLNIFSSSSSWCCEILSLCICIHIYSLLLVCCWWGCVFILDETSLHFYLRYYSCVI